jgi:hypothetical protein
MEQEDNRTLSSRTIEYGTRNNRTLSSRTIEYGTRR